MKNFDRILIALDRSPQGKQVFDHALDLAMHKGGQLKIVHCLDIDTELDVAPIGTGLELDLPIMVWEMQQERLKAELAKTKAWLQPYTETCQQNGILAESSYFVGSPGVWICRVAQEWKANLIVVGRRGRRGLAEVVLGSVSNYVIHHAQCSVLVVQGESDKEPSPQDTTPHR